MDVLVGRTEHVYDANVLSENIEFLNRIHGVSLKFTDDIDLKYVYFRYLGLTI